MQYYFMLAGSYKNRLTYFCRKFVFNKQILRVEPDRKQQGKNADDNNRINGGGQNVCFNNFSLRAGKLTRRLFLLRKTGFFCCSLCKKSFSSSDNRSDYH